MSKRAGDVRKRKYVYNQIENDERLCVWQQQAKELTHTPTQDAKCYLLLNVKIELWSNKNRNPESVRFACAPRT